MQITAGVVGTTELANNAVTSVKLTDGAVTVAKLAASAPTSGQILSYNGSQLSWSTPSAPAIGDSSISAAKLNTGAGSTGQVLVLDSSAPGGFKWTTLSTGSATPSGPAGGVLSGTYPDPSLAANAVTTSALTDASVTSVKLASAAVTPVKIDTNGDVPAGGEVLSYNSTSQKFEWIAPATYSQVNADWSAASGVAQILNKPTLATVATTGDYASLINKPTIPSQLNAVAGTNVTITGTYPDLTFSATPGAGVTDLNTTTTASSVTVVSSTGNDATIAAATTSNAGVLSSADKTKLDGIASGATANQTDAYLVDRSHHTGVQAIATVSGLQTALDGKIDTSQIGSASGVAGLDGSGKVPSSQLPSYVDDVLEYANLAAFPVTGATGLIYVALDSNKIYRWGGSSYIEVSPGNPDPSVGGDLSGTASNAQIVAGAVGTTEIADGAVTTAKIADGTITSSDLNSSVTALLTDDIRNQYTLAQVANYYIKSSDATRSAGILQAAASQTANILEVRDR